jgi:phenylalanyl-tRNA synthetase alpha chain
MSPTILGADDVRRMLSLRDLTDPSSGPHALQLLLADVRTALAAAWHCDTEVVRAHPVVSVADNYDRLRYPPDGAARDARYTRYVSPTEVLRTQTSALVPPALRRLAAAPRPEVLLLCPGLVYRRDSIDRLHVGEPHQLDLWRIRRGPPLGTSDLRDMITRVVGALLPGRIWRAVPAVHPYTTGGLQVDVDTGGAWVEVLECGLAHPRVLEDAGLSPSTWSGLAMGMGLDRTLMLRKGIEDIRLLRDDDPRVAAQMLDLAPYRSVSRHPPVRRDLSIATAAADGAEELGDRVRAALGDEAACVEAVEVVSETPLSELPAAAQERLGIAPGQKNVLVRLTLRHPSRTLTDADANRLRDAVYAALHQGSAWQWACGSRPA